MKTISLLAFALGTLGCGGSSTSGDGAITLGAKQLPGYQIDFGATLTLEQSGFGVTSASSGRYRLLWVGTASDVLQGQVTTDGMFDPTATSPLGGKELVTNNPQLISFHLNPSAATNGLDLVTSGGPIYLDLTRNADHALASISFVRQGARELSAHNPVAIEALISR